MEQTLDFLRKYGMSFFVMNGDGRSGGIVLYSPGCFGLI